MRCLICREDKPKAGTCFFRSIYSIDEITGEKYMICPECVKKMQENRWQGFEYCRSHGARDSVRYYFMEGRISAKNYERICYAFVEEEAENLLGKKPQYILLLHSGFVAIDEPTQRIVLDKRNIKFEEIESYKIFDNSIEYHIQTPNDTKYNIVTNKGLRRTIVGGIIAGPTGALMGGLTAKHSMAIKEGQKITYDTTKHDFSLVVKLKTLRYGGSVVVEIGNDEAQLQTLVNTIEKIIELY